jgi:predicted nuclease with TOPRIM domain
MDLQNSLAVEAISIAVLAILGIVFGIKKVLKEFKLSDAGDSVLNLMHKELERMSAQNTLLSTELNKLQQEIITLNMQLRQLCIENDKLQTEVIALTNKLNLLKQPSDSGSI